MPNSWIFKTWTHAAPVIDAIQVHWLAATAKLQIRDLKHAYGGSPR
jgi:hypothetical protein